MRQKIFRHVIILSNRYDLSFGNALKKREEHFL
jgi:hypothetical protein